MAATPDFVVVGHTARDIVPGGFVLGGTVTYAAVQAHKLGLRVGVVTVGTKELGIEAGLPFAEVVRVDAEADTTFENVYAAGARAQRILAVAPDLHVEHMPPAWRSAPIVLLGPLFREIAPETAAWFASGSLVAVSAQGWVRASDADGRVRHEAWSGAPYWAGADVLFASDEDLAGDESELARWVADVPVVAVTRSSRGARVFEHGRVMEMAAYPTEDVDATGAGDTFATAFLVRFAEGGDVAEAARFGAASASLSVMGAGVEAIAGREAIEGRMAAYPDVALRARD
jgi:sugar/nucleoside kinase (ribokinase family)